MDQYIVDLNLLIRNPNNIIPILNDMDRVTEKELFSAFSQILKLPVYTLSKIISLPEFCIFIKKNHRALRKLQKSNRNEK